MKIRKAKIGDLNNIYNLMKSSKELKNSTNNSYFNKNFLKIIIKDPGVVFLVVEEDKRIIGVLGAAIWKREKICYADFIFINPKYRGKGIGIKLHKYFIKTLRKEGINYLWTIIKKDDNSLQKAFNKFKFKKQYLCYYYDMKIK